MRRLIALFAALLIMAGFAAPAQAGTVTFGTRSGNVVTYVNDTGSVTQGYIEAFYTGGKTATFVASDNALNFSVGTHVTYKRVLEKWGTRYYWVNRYVFDGYNIYLNVPAHSTVTVTGTVN